MLLSPPPLFYDSITVTQEHPFSSLLRMAMADLSVFEGDSHSGGGMIQEQGWLVHAKALYSSWVEESCVVDCRP